jgi:hypothetical protein
METAFVRIRIGGEMIQRTGYSGEYKIGPHYFVMGTNGGFHSCAPMLTKVHESNYVEGFGPDEYESSVWEKATEDDWDQLLSDQDFRDDWKELEDSCIRTSIACRY